MRTLPQKQAQFKVNRKRQTPTQKLMRSLKGKTVQGQIRTLEKYPALVRIERVVEG